jgi:hypothetical protein
LIAVNPLFHAGLCISQWPISNLEWGYPRLTTPARLIGIVLFCADVSISTIGCSDYSLRNFPLAIRRRAAI